MNNLLGKIFWVTLTNSFIAREIGLGKEKKNIGEFGATYLPSKTTNQHSTDCILFYSRSKNRLTTMAVATPLCNYIHQSPPKLLLSPPSPFSLHHRLNFLHPLQIRPQIATFRSFSARRSPEYLKRNSRRIDEDEIQDEGDGVKRKIVQTGLWIMEGVYILWLFLLPYAPGDPVWAISSDTINSLLGLSLNFFFILPLANAVGIHVMEAPVLHPMSEGLFNFVVGWTLLFAPLLYTDVKNDRYKSSLDVLWGLQMFLTNTFLIPYMAIRLNKADGEDYPRKPSQLGTSMIQGAPIVGLVGGAASLVSILWALFGRMDGDFGSLTQRWDFLLSYLGSERLAYAFIWDIVLYTIFQPWLIGNNLANLQEDKVAIVNYLRFVPVIGLVAYLLCLNREEELYMAKNSLND